MDSSPASTHPLMPGIRSAEINCPDWPRTLHDKQLTGFSPLVLGMTEAPDVWQSIDIPGVYHWVEAVKTTTGPAFLVDDGRITLYGTDGRPHWRAPISGKLVFWGDLFADGSKVGLLRRANRLWVVDGGTGDIRWQQVYDPPHVDLRLCVGKVLPGVDGLQVAAVEQYGEAGRLLSFEADGEVREVWRRQVIANDVWPVRADHGCDVAFDLSLESPLLWNVRHHRCQSFDAATGASMGCVQYELEGAFRRNYGPWRIATGSPNQRAIAVVSEMVQTHVHGLHLHPDGTPELAWDRYYGEVYVVPGVAVEYLGVDDVDGDGIDEVVYNVRDPENDYRSFVRARDVATGVVKYELADQWCSAMTGGIGTAWQTVLLVHPAPEGATPEQGPLQVVSLRDGTVHVLHEFDHAAPWGSVPTKLDQPSGRRAGPKAHGPDAGVHLFLRVVEKSRPVIVRWDGADVVDRFEAGPALAAPFGACIDEGGSLRIVNALGLFGSSDPAATPLDLEGGAPATLSAAAWGTEGRTQLLAHVPGHRIRAWDLSGTVPAASEPREESAAPRPSVPMLDEPFLGESARYSPLLYDLDGDGQLELVIPGASATGELTVRALRADGTDLWEVTLPKARTDDQGKAIAWNAGHFLLDGDSARAAVAISIYSHRRVQEGTYLLAGADGRVHWFRGTFHDENHIRAYRPVGIPGAFDWDGDGAEEIAWDMYSYMAFLRGDGEFAALFGGPNVRPEPEAVPAISLYNGFTPVYRSVSDDRPHWLVHHGHGRFGVVGTDPVQGLWHEDVGYDTPDRVGFVDVDGDGTLEVGYTLRNSTEFLCRDIWTGMTKWSVELPSAPSGPVISADVDGDGKGEFLVDRWCIGTDASGHGEIRWTSPVPLGWAVIGDFDGDGLGEIACAHQGQISILKA